MEAGQIVGLMGLERAGKPRSSFPGRLYTPQHGDILFEVSHTLLRPPTIAMARAHVQNLAPSRP
jgi:hypothetical protein